METVFWGEDPISAARTAVEWRDRIVIDPNVLTGKPVIKGSHLAVEFIVEVLFC